MYYKGEKSLYSYHKLSCNQETDCLLDCEKYNQETGCLLENLEHKDKGSQGVFKVSKGFKEIVENFK